MHTNNYIKLPAASTENVIDFLVQALDFEVINANYVVGEEKGILLNNRYGNTLVITKLSDGAKPVKSVTINTSDCLKSCFRLSACGVKIVSQPYYTDQGLAAEVADQFGNHYILMEERSLIEN
jgi:hypothetical protein